MTKVDTNLPKNWETSVEVWQTLTKMCQNIWRKDFLFQKRLEFGAVQKCGNLVDLKKCSIMNVYLQKSSSILQPRTSSPKSYDHMLC